MKKQTIIVISLPVLAIVCIFVYVKAVFGDDSPEQTDMNRVALPQLEIQKNTYSTRLEAVQAREEKAERARPSLYDETFFEGGNKETLEEDPKEEVKKEVEQKIAKSSKKKLKKAPINKPVKPKAYGQTSSKESIAEKEERIRHRREAYFGSTKETGPAAPKKIEVRAVVYRNQYVELNQILELRFKEDFVFKGKIYPSKSTPLFGKITGVKKSFIQIEVNQIGQQLVTLYAYDPRMSSERGLYKEEAYELNDRFQNMGENELNQAINSGSTAGRVLRGAVKIVSNKKKNLKKYQSPAEPS